jgi:hypothetical protein
MGRAKDIIVKVIPAKIANEFVKKHHYSGKYATTSYIHFGAFLDGKLHGVMSFGGPLDKRKVLPLVKYTLWNEMLELNRMAFDDYLPKNSESRCLSIVFKMIKKNAPHIKWILSFSDGTQSGDGTIYRASGFCLTQINKNKTLLLFPDGEKVASTVITGHYTDKNGVAQQLAKKYNIEIKSAAIKPFLNAGAKFIDGYQLRYIYLIDKTCKITVPIIPFSKIDEIGAGMYKGKKVSIKERQQAQLHHKGDGAAFQPSGAFDSTAALKITTN